MEEKEFTARPYQIDLYEKALQSNTIIYLPTGTGKTFIAIMVLKKLSGDVQKPYSEGGKRTIFLVNTVPLVTQQAEYIGRHTGLLCKGYCGDMQVDIWTKEIWFQEIEKNQVLVMTSQIFLDIICRGYLQLSSVNLIIFDECHRGVHDHPMRQIMQRFEEYPQDKQPQILGLSATLLNANIKLQNIIDSIKSLEITFQSKIVTVGNVQGYSTNPKEVIIYYETYTHPESWYGAAKNLDCLLELLDHIFIEDTFENNASSKEFKPKSVQSKLKNLYQYVL